MKAFRLFFLAILGSLQVLWAQPVGAPQLRCLNVACPSGDVSLSWTVPPDPGGTFVAYHIFRNNSQIASIPNRLINTYTDLGAGAHLQSYCYYVEVESFTGVTVITPAFDTLCTMFLTVTNSGNSVAQLSWNAPRTPLLSSSSTWYKIYRDFPFQWTFVDSTQSLTYLDTVHVCNRTVNYVVQLADNFPCLNISNCDGDVFKDNTVLLTPVIDTVSVNPGNDAIMSWAISPSQDVVAYVIYQYISGLWVAIDTVYGYLNNNYVNNNSSADVQSEWYSIAAMDSCGNLSPLSTYHQTIFLNASLDRCNRKINLSWNPYINWTSGVKEYQVWVSKDGQPWVMAGVTSPGVLQFSYGGLVSGSNYCFFIRAWDNTMTKSSRSNTRCVFASIAPSPSYTYIEAGTVTVPGNVRLDVWVDNTVPTKSFVIERSDFSTGPFLPVGTVAFTGAPNFSFNDNTALTEEKSYYYRVVSMDSCQKPSDTSQIIRTVHCNSLGNPGMYNMVSWNAYEGFDAGVGSYDIFRSIDGGAFMLVTTVGPGTLQYYDDAEPFFQNIGRFDYYIIANEAPGNTYNLSGAAFSNIAECFQPPKVFVPNAFVPKGVNNVFIPQGSFYDKTDYNFSIFNRWGQLIFSTDNPTVGWDGTAGGDVVQQGVYVWLLTFKGASGEYFERNGTVTLIGK